MLCLGLDATLEGEEGDTGNEFSSGDKKDLRLPESQRILLDKIRQTGKPLIVVVAAGSAITLDTEPDALIHAWYPGSEGGKALAEILFGEISPSGKLPVTFYESADALPDFTDYRMQGRTYRYTRDNVRYTFGYGLTYGKIVCTGVTYADGVAEVTVENAGAWDTGDVVQLYLKDTCPQATPFPKVYRIAVPERAFTAVDADGTRKQFGSAFTLYAGTCQPDEKSQTLSGTSCVSCEIVR